MYSKLKKAWHGISGSTQEWKTYHKQVKYDILLSASGETHSGKGVIHVTLNDYMVINGDCIDVEKEKWKCFLMFHDIDTV